MKKMALVLQGGGALGAVEYGVVTKLVELGWQPVAVTGVSIGAVNAAAIAGAKDGDIVASLHSMWDAITLPSVPWMPAAMQGASLRCWRNWTANCRPRARYANVPLSRG